MSDTPSSGLLIEAEGIAKRIGQRDVLVDAALSVGEGEVVTLIGPNGAGKSTLIRILLGLLKPDRGRVVRRSGLTIGYLPQRFPIDPALPLTVARFLSLAGAADDDIGAILEEVGVGSAADTQIHDLSGGEFQRVLLARALARRPDLLVLDEPLQGVDIAGQADLYRRIGQLRRRLGAGVLLVSHDLHLVMAETDRVVCINHHVCCAGQPEVVSRHPEYLALFGPAVAVYTHSHDHDHDPAGEVVPLAPEREGGGEHG
ncbi:MAG: ATP-binding cassette domain-containing protein [Alphaproteobacteria bacterium]|nr:ATP-binding cassette domain-containing protein [Alphaproteobacteria bacterium]